MTSYVAQANTGADALVSSRSVSKPGGVSTGDVGVFWLARWEGSNSFPAVTPPAGAVLRATITGSSLQTLIYIQKVGAETSYAYSWTGSRWSALGVQFFSGVDAALDYTTVPLHNLTATGTAISTLTVTTVDTAALSWHVNTLSGGSAHTPPTSFTEDADVNAWSTAYRISPGTGSQSAAGATLASSTVWVAGLVALAPASGSTAASGADTGTETEAQSIAATLSNSDSEAATEGTARISFTNSDSGSGTEGQTIAATLSSTDSVGATEAVTIYVTSSDGLGATEGQSLAATIAGSDSGLATDAQGEAATIPGSDSGSVTDTGRLALTSSDTGSGADNGTLAVTLLNSDSDTASEGTSQISFARSDSASGTEAQSNSVTLSTSDNIISAEGQSISAMLAASDSGIVTESGGTDTSAQKSDTDSFAATDSGSVAATLSSADAISSQEVQGLNSQVQDSVSATESVQIQVSSSDAATATESQIVYVFSSDGVTAVESQNLAATVAQADSGTVTDMWIVHANLSATDAISVMESGQASEDVGLTAEFSPPFTDPYTFSKPSTSTYITLALPQTTFRMRQYTEEVEE